MIILFNFAYYLVDSATSRVSGQLVYSLVEKINESEFIINIVNIKIQSLSLFSKTT